MGQVGLQVVSVKNFHEAKNMSELGALVGALEEQFRGMQGAGHLKVQDVQVMVGALTRFQLLLNEFERVEVRGNGVSREAAERFALLEGRIRTLRGNLFDELRRNAPSMASSA